MGSNRDGSEDQYDESYDWDEEGSNSKEMEFSGPEESDIEASMDLDDPECTCLDEDALYVACGHESDCPACDCELETCDECDCETDHSHLQDECQDCVCLVEPCDSCDCPLDHWEGDEDCACEKSHSKKQPKLGSRTREWNLDEDRQLVAQYLNYIDLAVISVEMGIPVDSLRFRLIFLCFRSKGIGVNSTKGANSGKAWTSKEDFFLRSNFYADASLKELSLAHQRSSLAIASRLIKLGLAVPIDVEEFYKSVTEI